MRGDVTLTLAGAVDAPEMDVTFLGGIFMQSPKRGRTRSAALLMSLASAPLWLSSTLYAATISNVSGQHCEIRLQGLIENGDLARLEAAVSASSVGDVCLDSLGGSYAEAVRIAEYLVQQRTIGTVIDKGASCYAACAYVFMAGRDAFEAITFPRRRLHVAGKLSVNSPQADEAKGDVQSAYEEGVKAIGSLIKLNGGSNDPGGKDSRLPFPKSFVVQVMKSMGQPVLIDTVDRAKQWAIDLLGVKAPLRLTKQELHQACVSSSIEPGGSQAEVIAADPIDVAPNKSTRLSFNKFGKKANEVCVVDVYNSPKSGLHIQTSFGDRVNSNQILPASHLKAMADETSRFGGGTPLWHIFTGLTKLADIPSN